MQVTLVGPGRIGAALLPKFRERGDETAVLSRREYGDFLASTFDPGAAVARLTGCDAVLLLAGRFELNADVERMGQANATGPIRVAEAIHARFPRAHVITFLDSRIHRAETDLPPAVRAYLEGKRRLARWTLAAARCWGQETGARVNAIAPGPVLPPPDRAHSEKAGACLTPRPTIEEVWGAVDFLLRTPSITGQILYVDAGQHLL